eukprot:6191551-Pleurochrysis_carterae.AAC.1
MGSVVLTISLIWAIYHLPSNLDDLSDLNDDSEYVPQKKSKGSLPISKTSTNSKNTSLSSPTDVISPDKIREV